MRAKAAIIAHRTGSVPEGGQPTALPPLPLNGLKCRDHLRASRAHFVSGIGVSSLYLACRHGASGGDDGGGGGGGGGDGTHHAITTNHGTLTVMMKKKSGCQPWGKAGGGKNTYSGLLSRGWQALARVSMGCLVCRSWVHAKARSGPITLLACYSMHAPWTLGTTCLCFQFGNNCMWDVCSKPIISIRRVLLWAYEQLLRMLIDAYLTRNCSTCIEHVSCFFS